MKGSPSKPADMERSVSEASELREELSRYVSASKLEFTRRRQLVDFMRRLQASLSAPVELDPHVLSEFFPRADEFRLERGEKLVAKTREGEVTETSILTLGPEPFAAVARTAAATLERLVEDEEARRAEAVKPRLWVAPAVVGAKFSIFDWRAYVLVVSNSGGTAFGVRVAGPSSGAMRGSFDIVGGSYVKLDLRRFKKLDSSGAVDLALTCGDVEGRKYGGKLTVDLRSAKKSEIPLRPA